MIVEVMRTKPKPRRRAQTPSASKQKREQRTRAKLFWTGRSQAVRLPKEFRFEGETVVIRREGRRVILEPEGGWPEGYIEWLRTGPLKDADFDVPRRGPARLVDPLAILDDPPRGSSKSLPRRRRRV